MMATRRPQRGNASDSHCAVCLPDGSPSPAMLLSVCTHGYLTQEEKEDYERKWAMWRRERRAVLAKAASY